MIRTSGALASVLTVAVGLAACGGGSSKLSSSGQVKAPSTQARSADATAEAIARTAQTAVETIATDDGSYAAITPSAVRQLVPVPVTGGSHSYLSVASGTDSTYKLTATSTSGDTFTVARRASGALTRTCTGTASSLCSHGAW